MSLVAAAIDRSRMVMLALAVILIAGAVAYNRIPKEAEPDVEIPYIYVRVSLEGVSPEDSERMLLRPLEQELRTIEGVKEMTSTAYEGGANVTLEFEAGVDTERAIQDVREHTDTAKADLPAEADEPQVTEVKLSRFDPMLVLNIGGSVPERTLYTLARRLRDQVEAVPGVLEANLVGNREEVMEVVVDPLSLESYHINQTDLLNFVSRNNRLVAAGSLQSREGEFPVKVPGTFQSAADILNLPVKVDGDKVVHFSDVATVRRTYKDPQSFARLNGQPAVALEVVQRAGANIIDTVNQVKALVAQSSAGWPAGVNIVASRDKSEQVVERLTDLQNNVISAVLLVFIVIIGILGLRNALLVGVAIPGSFLGAILLLGIFNVTINIVVLFGLIMAVGMLVDGAIVVTELADRKMTEGMHRAPAYAFAAQRMAWPIISSTATTLAAFLPLLFWPGIMGKFMSYLPMTLMATLAMSLLMALIFVPTLGATFGRPGAVGERSRRDLIAAETGDLSTIGGYTGAYLRFLRLALRRPWVPLAAVTLLLVVIVAAYAHFGRGVELFPDIEPDTATIDIRARGDLSPQEKNILVRQVEDRVLGMPEIKSLYTRVGGTNNTGPKDLIGSLTLNLVDWKQRRPANEILADIRRRTSDIAGIIIDAVKPQQGPQQGKPIDVEFASDDPAALNDAIAKVRPVLAAIPGVINIQDSRTLPGIEWRINVDRARAARFGADVTQVGNTVQFVTNGVKIGEYRPSDSDDEIDIRVRFPRDDRNLAQIDQLRVTTGDGNVPISNFVQRYPAQKVGNIERTDMRRTLNIQSDLAPGVLVNDVLARLSARIPELGLDPRVSYRFRGGNEQQNEASSFLSEAMLVALALMAIILVTQFNSFFQALLILTAVVFATGGVLLGHLVTGSPFGIIMSGVGTIALAGIVVNNNIVLVDTYNLIRREAATPLEAILRTAAQRLRPVMLTTVTTILGLMPMVLHLNIDLINREVDVGGPSSQWWAQMSSAVAGGLAFSTVLTLVLTPSLLLMQAQISERRRARRERRQAVLQG